MTETLALSDALRLLTDDNAALREAIAGADPAALTETYTVDGRPLGDSCDSLHDLVAHHTMWLEIDLAVLVEARSGRRHWSTTSLWSAPEVGQRLNRSGVAAGRIMLTDELTDRFESSCAALLHAMESLDEELWQEEIFQQEGITLGQWLQTHISVPGQRPFSHASLHLHGFTEG